MTDLPAVLSVPARLGVTGRLDGDRLVLVLEPRAEVLVHGMVRASVLAYAVDAVAGITVDRDRDTWTFTTDLSLRVRPLPAPRQVLAGAAVLRRGRRSVTCGVELTGDDGGPVGTAVIGFAHVPRRPGDPVKPDITPQRAVALFSELPGLTRPVRDEAGIRVLDAAAGIVEVAVTPELQNPAGTLQGAMVALVAEAAAEDLLSSLAGAPMAVTELDIRYLAQSGAGPVRTHSRLLGEGPDSPVEVGLVDTSTGTLTTLVYARAVPVEA